MNDYISTLTIQSFRGIKDLTIDNIAGINVLVGGNNTGKTSVLEAIQLFCNPSEYELIRISKQRDRYRSLSRTKLTTLDSLLFLFNSHSDFDKCTNYGIDISGTINNVSGTLSIEGRLVQELLDLTTLTNPNFLSRVFSHDDDSHLEEEVSTFIGSLKCTYPLRQQINISEKTTDINLEINEYSRFVDDSEANPIIHVEMIHTVDHILQNTFSKLLKNKKIKDIAVEMLKKFDSTIVDIRYINEKTRFVPIIENCEGTYIPLSFYGDGMKKALTILNAIISAKSGIVLLDEFETALHTSIMKPVFRFMIEVAQELNVQLFLTTHSIEAVDKLLEASQEYIKDVRIIRLKKMEEKTFAKVTAGDIALENRIEYDMELRI